MRTKLLLVVLILHSTCCILNSYGQQQLFYACTGYGKLHKLNIATCDTFFIGSTDTSGVYTVTLTDIAITSDYSLYGIDGTYLYQIDTSNAHLTIISHLNNTLSQINALVADSSGNLLTVNHDSLYQINRFTGQSFSLGYIGYNSGGDLAFYNDTLYMTGGLGGKDLIKIILHPIVSAQLVGTMNATNIFGVNTVCINNSETMIITGGSISPPYSNLYKVNPANASLTLLCDSILHNDIIYGAASIYDINGSGEEAACMTITGLLNTASSNNALQLFPNPLTSSSTLQLSAQVNNAEVVIYDMVGKELLRKKLTGDRMEIERGSLESGVYFVKVVNEDRQWIEKMVVE